LRSAKSYMPADSTIAAIRSNGKLGTFRFQGNFN
jgi:hypothetical protein